MQLLYPSQETGEWIFIYLKKHEEILNFDILNWWI